VRTRIATSLSPKVLGVFALAVWVLAQFHAGAASRWEWSGVPRVVGIGDIHGALDQLTAVLTRAGVVDAGLAWTGGSGHVVFCGDLVDRGPADRAVLDLVRRLQQEADAAGGRVHVLLGNHEVMNLVRDLRYVSEESHREFAADERAGDRDEAWREFRRQNASSGMPEAEVRAAFGKRYPPGYFGRVRAFGPSGTYGGWLRDLPALVKVNGVVFVHGGLTPEVAAVGLDDINAQVRDSLRAAMGSIDALQRLVPLPLGYGEAVTLAGRVTRTPDAAPDALAAARDLLRQTSSGLPFAPLGPLWYRGVSLENERAEREAVSKALAALGARAMMVGHTVTRKRQVTSRFNARVYRGDVGMVFGATPAAVEFRGDSVAVLGGSSPASPVPEPPQGEGWDGAFEHLPDDRLLSFLAAAPVGSSRAITRGARTADLVRLKGEGLELRGVFKDVAVAGPPPRRWQHEIAAFRLDRLLGLHMVPAVVERKVGRRTGSLRVALEDALDLVSIKSYEGLEGLDRESLGARIAERYGLHVEALRRTALQMWVFDALIGNPSRADEDKLILPAEGRGALVNHEHAFPLSREVTAYLPEPCPPLDPALGMGIRQLTRESVAGAVGGYLSGAQIDALLARRDVVLERCPAVNGATR
jgi:hypothetical protein